MAAVLPGRDWPQVVPWRGVLVLLVLLSSSCSSSKSWAGGTEEEGMLRLSNGDASHHWCLSIWWATYTWDPGFKLAWLVWYGLLEGQVGEETGGRMGVRGEL